MLLSHEQIATLKKNLSVSKNPDKTKERVQADFKAATKEQKNTILELSGQAANSIYRVYNTGSVNARIVMAMAQTLNVQPWYYTGEVDERASADDGQMLQFLKVHGYNNLVKELGEKPPKRKYNRKPKDENAAPAETPAPIEVKAEEAPTVAEKYADVRWYEPYAELFGSSKLTKEESVQLLEALLTQAKYSEDAAKKLVVVERLLLTDR